MRSTVAATAAIILAMAATTASAGVVISQNVVDTDNAGKQHKSEQTIMLQGNKEKLILPERAIITDLDAGKMYVLIPSAKRAAALPLPPPERVAMIMARMGMFVGYQKTTGGGKVGGYDCQNYAGSENVGKIKIDATACVASAAAGAPEFVAFRKGLADKLKNSTFAPKGDVPDGIPVASTLTTSFVPFPVPGGVPADQAAKIKQAEAKARPEVKSVKVTKIQVKDLPADTFAIPAEYKTQVAPKKPAAASKPAAAASPAH